ncbi:REJ domain-containing protein [Pavlovales sp. CCMP2436]|nr:REJ domain-containing protein [Pavlovales sp. CCMP2436]
MALGFAWSVSRLGGDEMLEALCSLPTGWLAGGYYLASVAVLYADGRGANASVSLHAVNAPVPRVTLAPLPGKPSADDRLVLRALAVTIDDVDAAVAALMAAGLATSAADALACNVHASELPWAYTWMAYSDSTSLAQLDLSDPAVSSTGPGRANLVLLPGAMVTGATYVFELSVSASAAGVGAAVVRLRVPLNRPSFGGELTYAPSSGVAAVTAFAVSATGWTDDDDQDMHLRFSSGRPTAGAEERSLLGELRLGSTAKVFLPAGNWRLLVRVTDQFGAAALGESASLCNRLQIDVAAAVGESDELTTAVDAPVSASVLLDANATGPVTLGLTQGARARMPVQLLEAQAGAQLSSNSVRLWAESVAAVLAMPGQRGETAQLHGDGVPIGDELRARRDGLVSRAARSLAAVLITDSLVGEAPRVASSTMVSVLALRSASSNLEGTSVQMPGSSAGSVQLGSAAAAAGGEGGLDVHIVVFHHDIHVAEAALALATGNASAALVGNPTDPTDPEPSLTSSVVSAIISIDLTLIGGDRLLVSGLAQPGLIALAFTRAVATAGPIGTSGTCAEYGGCRGRGACVGGGCLCEAPWRGAECSLRAECAYWDELAFAPSAAAPLGNETVGCASTHLTDFAAVYLPASAEDLKTKLEDNPWIYGLVFGLVGLDLLGLLVAHAYDRRARLRELPVTTAAAKFARASAESKASGTFPAAVLGTVQTAFILRPPTLHAAQISSRVERTLKSARTAASHASTRVERLAERVERVADGISSRVRAMRESDATTAVTAKSSDHKLTRWIRQFGLAMTTEHTLLTLWSSDGSTSRRAEHLQILANTLALQLVLGSVFYSEEPGDGSTHPLQVVLLAVITAGLCAPALAVFKLTFALAKDQPPRLLDRLFKMLAAVPARTSKRGAGGWKRVHRAQADGAGTQKPLSLWRTAHALSRQAVSAPAAEMRSATLRRRARGSSQEALPAEEGLAAGTVRRRSAQGGDSMQRPAAQPLGARWSSSARAPPDWQAQLPVRRASLAPTMRVNSLDVVRKDPVGRLTPLVPLTAAGLSTRVALPISYGSDDDGSSFDERERLQIEHDADDFDAAHQRGEDAHIARTAAYADRPRARSPSAGTGASLEPCAHDARESVRCGAQGPGWQAYPAVPLTVAGLSTRDAPPISYGSDDDGSSFDERERVQIEHSADDFDASRLAPSPPPSPPAGERRRWQPKPPPSEDEPPTSHVRGISWPPILSQATPMASPSKWKKSSVLSESRATGASVRSEASSLSKSHASGGSMRSEASSRSEASLRVTELDMDNIHALLVELDVDSSEALDLAELPVLLERLGEKVPPRAAAAIFRRLDRDGDGKASLDEIEQCCGRGAAYRGAAKHLLAWLAMLGLYAAFLVLILAYGLQFGDAKVARLVQSWGVGLSQTFALEEPIMILIAELIPAAINLGEQALRRDRE